ncbi:MAG: hypothetical protein WCE73_03615, partial [Candidatus Angelobacter sp.]
MQHARRIRQQVLRRLTWPWTPVNFREQTWSEGLFVVLPRQRQSFKRAERQQPIKRAGTVH